MNDMLMKNGTISKGKKLEKGYSTQELSEMLGVSVGLINNIENAKIDSFNLELMEKLCSTLEIPLISFLTKAEELRNFLYILQDVPAQISEQINNIISEFINAAIILNFNLDKLHMLQDKLLYEIYFVTKFNK